MGERKVLNKYIPADFDPRLVPRSKKPKDEQVTVRMMLPFTIQCKTCSTFLYRGRKFNSKKENMKGPEGKYLGIQRFRFYIKCSQCSMPITFLTDPQNTDYEMESGGTRNYEVWKDKEKTEGEILKDKEEENKKDSMRALENRVLDSQKEMAELDALDEIKAMNMRHAKMGRGGFDVDNILNANAKEENKDKHFVVEQNLNENGLTSEEEALVRSIKFRKGSRLGHSEVVIKRINDKDDDIERIEREKRKRKLEEQQRELHNKMSSKLKGLPGIVGVPTLKCRKKTPSVVSEVNASKQVTESQFSKDNDTSENEGLNSLLGGYGSSSDDSE